MTHFFVGYIPVVNKRYLELTEQYRGFMGVFGPFVRTLFPHLERDVRALEPEQVADLLGCMVVGEEKFAAICHEVQTAGLRLVMPDEDVSHGIASIYFPEVDVEYLPVWLRWDRKNATSQQVVQPDKRFTSDQFAVEVMQLAYEEAKRSSDWWRQVGALLITEGRLPLVAHNHHLPTPWSIEVDGDPRFNFSWGEGIECCTAIHAEAAIIAQAAKRGLATQGAAIYATTFPCQVCARLIKEAGIKKVYYSEGYSQADAWQIFSLAGIEVVQVVPPESS